MGLRLFELQYTFVSIITILLMAVKLFALVDAVSRPARAYIAAEKLTKPAWLWITGLSLVAQIVSSPIELLGIIGTIASIVYLVDVRPALASLTRRR